MPIEIFQITAAYSNALLVAVMPHVSDFASKLALPTVQPVMQSQIRHFDCFPRTDHIGGRLVLTNGCEFIFDHGHVENFVSPHSYFYLQNPDLVPKFYGEIKISETQAIQLARDAIKKLGYSQSILAADRSPQVTPPEKHDGKYIARYRIRWFDPTRGGNPNRPPTSAEFEIDATTGQLVAVNILNPNTYRPAPDLKIHPLVSEEKAGVETVGSGRKILPVSNSYAKAFLPAILPQCSHFCDVAGFKIKLPLTLNDVEQTSYTCGLVDGDPMASFQLKSGDRFDYRHGQVIAFYEKDVMNLPGREHAVTYPEIDREREKYFGPVRMSTDAAVDLVKQALRRLGYDETNLHINVPPKISEPGWWGTNRIARCFIAWSGKGGLPTYVNAEVNVDKKTLESLYINDHANTNIWREPPKMEAPMIAPTASPK